MAASATATPSRGAAPAPARGAARTLAALLAVAAAPAVADSLRCGSHLVHEGDPIARVAAICGQPSDVQHRSVLRRPAVWLHGRPYYLSADPVEVPVEIWTYNLGPRKLMRRVRFEDGLVVAIETLGYGHYEDAAKPR